jgi:hypothetical protein
VSGSESSTRIRTFPDWSESSGHRIRMTCDAHDGGDSPRKTITRPKSGLKIKICLKSTFLPPQVHIRVRIRATRIRDSDPGLGSGPKSGSGLIRWHQSGERILGSSLDPTRTALPLIRTGTQYTLGPDLISCLWPTMEKKNGQTGKKKIGHTKRTHLSQRKRSPNCFFICFCFCFCSTPFFFMI